MLLNEVGQFLLQVQEFAAAGYVGRRCRRGRDIAGNRFQVDENAVDAGGERGGRPFKGFFYGLHVTPAPGPSGAGAFPITSILYV
ncbi:hypothetical protein ACFVTE_17990 [Arthrobacter sp. NPDC058097]|uniref:hypothetical protein n=1 Tax=Arthrobacter sp. NPDC058097 TaxID=3346340 RepID=UPI0036DBF9D5